MTRRRGRWGAGGADTRAARVEVRMPQAMRQRMLLVVALAGERQTEWVRRKVAEAIDRELDRTRAFCALLRPRARIYQQERGCYVPIACAAGGERAWIIATVADLPRSQAAEGIAFLCDITSDEGGFEGRNVVVPAEDLVGAPNQRGEPLP